MGLAGCVHSSLCITAAYRRLLRGSVRTNLVIALQALIQKQKVFFRFVVSFTGPYPKRHFSSFNAQTYSMEVGVESVGHGQLFCFRCRIDQTPSSPRNVRRARNLLCPIPLAPINEFEHFIFLELLILLFSAEFRRETLSIVPQYTWAASHTLRSVQRGHSKV